MPNGKVLVAGGDNSGGFNPWATAEVFVSTGAGWTSTGSAFSGGKFHTAVLLPNPNGQVLVVPNNSNSFRTEIYYSTAAVWRTAATALSSPRNYNTATLLPNGTILAAGGNNGSNGSGGTALATAVLTSSSGGSWSTTGAMTTAREWHTATLLPNGSVLVAGGSANGTSSSPPRGALTAPSAGTWATTGSDDHDSAHKPYRHAHTLPNGNVLV